MVGTKFTCSQTPGQRGETHVYGVDFEPMLAFFTPLLNEAVKCFQQTGHLYPAYCVSDDPHLILLTEIVTMKVKALFLMFGLALVTMQATAVTAIGGNDTTVDVVVPVCTSLVEQDIFVPQGETYYCAVTGSSDALNPDQDPVAKRVGFNLTLDNLFCDPLDGGMERTLEFSDMIRLKHITSTGFFEIGQGNHVIRWTARPIAAAPALTVLDSSLSVVCTDEEQLPYTPIPDYGND